MPYGIKTILRAGTGDMRSGTVCWVQRGFNADVQATGAIRVVGLSRGRRSISTLLNSSDTAPFQACWFSGDYPARLVCESRQQAGELAALITDAASSSASPETHDFVWSVF